MKWTILGSGGCTVIPRPTCRCRVCSEAREKGVPYARGGPSAFLHDINLLIDTPAEISAQLNRSGIERVDRLLFTHFDPDHAEGFRVVEQIALDFRTWQAYPEKQVRLLVPRPLEGALAGLRSQYGPLIDFYRESGFVRLEIFESSVTIQGITITAIPVDRGSQVSCVYIFEGAGRRVVYAPCDLKPFPEEHPAIGQPDLLIIQPGIFETGLRHSFEYPEDHVSRTTLYTFDETRELAARIGARQVVLVHLEEYWNRSYDDYLAVEAQHPGLRFACDGMGIEV